MTSCDLGRPTHPAVTAGWAPDPQRALGSASAMVSLFLLGSTAPVAALIRDVPVLISQGLRFGIAGVLLTGALAVTGRLRAARPRVRHLPLIALLGTAGVAGFGIFSTAATFHADPALVGSVLAATPVLLAVIGPLTQRRRPTLAVSCGALVVSAGTAVAAGSGSATVLGVLFAVGAVGSELAFTLLALPLIRQYGALTAGTYATVAGAAVLLVSGLISEGGRTGLAHAPATDLLAIGFLALALSIGANLTWYSALPRIGPDRAGLFYAFTPIGAVVAGLAVGTSAPGPTQFAGMSLVIVGLIIGLSRSVRRGSPADVAADRPQP